MLWNGGHQLNQHSEEPGEEKRSLFTTLFIRYGDGAKLLKPLTTGKVWNTVAWILVVLGVIGWIMFLRWEPYGE